MMQNFVAVPLSTGSHRITWTGIDGAVVRVFVNGLLAFGPVAVAGTSKSVELSLSDPCTLEVHEDTDGASVEAAGVPLQRRPLAWWPTVAAADRYALSRGGVVLASVLAEAGVAHQQFQLLQDVRVDGTAAPWVEIITAAQNDATAATSSGAGARHYARGVPAQPASVGIAGSGGTFTITITP